MVMDSNFIAALVIESDATAEARRIYLDAGEHLVPTLWRHEMLNILSKYLKAGLMSTADAEHILAAARKIVAHGECEIPPGEVFALVSEAGITAYDAQFVALARRCGRPLYTRDKELLAKFPADTRRF